MSWEFLKHAFMEASNHFVNYRVYFWTWILASKCPILKIGVGNLSEIQENSRLEGKRKIWFINLYVRGDSDKSNNNWCLWNMLGVFMCINLLQNPKK